MQSTSVQSSGVKRRRPFFGVASIALPVLAFVAAYVWTKLFGPSAGSDATVGNAFMLANVARVVFGLGSVLAIIGLARRERYLLISCVGFVMGAGPLIYEYICRKLAGA
jgi:hypothetical protein